MCTYQSFGSWLWLHSTTRTVNYDSKTHVIVDSRISGSFSIVIRQVVRHFLRLTSSHCENLISQNTYLHQLQSFSRSHLVSFLLEQKFCSGYVSTALSKTIIDNWIHVLILPKIRKDTNWTRKNTSCSWLKLKLKRPKKHISVTLLTLMTMTLKVKEYRQNQIVRSLYKSLAWVQAPSSPSCVDPTTVFIGIVFSCGCAAIIYVQLVVIISTIPDKRNLFQRRCV